MASMPPINDRVMSRRYGQSCRHPETAKLHSLATPPSCVRVRWRFGAHLSSTLPLTLDLNGATFSRMTTGERTSQLELLQGTLDLLILRTLAFGPAHGHAIARIIQQRSDEVLQVGHGSLYPALQRLLRHGLIVAEDGLSENNRKARFYRLTAKGRKRLTAETSK